MLLERCAALDVHQASVSACVRVPDQQDGRRVCVPDQQAGRREINERFGTTTPDLLALSDWLRGHGVTQVVMEGTGVYWTPIYYALEDEFELLLVNAAHVKQVPGRKTDTKDAAWLCRLLECGLLRASFVPPKPIRELRDLTRYRKTLIRDRAAEANRLHKVLEDAGIKLSSVASDVLGVSGRLMLEALCQGTNDPVALAELARGRLRSKLPALRRALESRFRDHHAFLVAQILGHLDYLDEAIAACSARIEEQIAPFAAALTLLETIPGVGRRNAEVILAEIGADMSVFPSSRHLASWAKLSPGNNESAGKRKSGSTGRGSPWLRSALVESALAATRTGGYLKAKYWRVRQRRGHQRAVIAVAHAILEITYHMLTTGELYRELGEDFFEQRDGERAKQRHLRALERLGYRVTVEAAPGQEAA
jgi:transposase